MVKAYHIFALKDHLGQKLNNTNDRKFKQRCGVDIALLKLGGEAKVLGSTSSG